MSHAQQELIERLFDAAQALEAGERDAYLSRECAHRPELLERVRSLLAAGAHAEHHLLNLVGRVNALALCDADLSEVSAGDRIGPYTVIELIGTGGMGEVWRAQRSDRLIERFVALKLPHGTWQRRGLAERMAQERSILSSLDHPNIARLLDTGVTEQGQPYLAIEYVQGVPIDQYCRERMLGIPERLRLFLQVIDAIAYAHAKLIVHRDVKPQNILVTERGQVRLLDFGIAKLLAQGAASDSTATRLAGQAITPDYAAPEQIMSEPITVAVDIYSLGVVLYELLTGQRPYRVTSTASSALEEAIVKTDVPPPSRADAPELVRRTLRGDLDTIVLKALKKNARERYATVHAFGDDIVRYLESRPVLAQPDSRLYCARKFLRRHRVGVAATALIALSLIGATGVSMRYAHIANEQSRRSAAERERADDIKNFLIEMLKGADPNLAPADVTVKTLVEERFTSIKDRFGDDPATKVELLQVFADVFEVLRLSELQSEAIDMRLALLERRDGSYSTPAYAQALAQRARAEQNRGDYAAAFDSVRAAMRINTTLGDQKALAANQHQLGLLHHLKGELEQAQSLYAQALDVRKAAYGTESLEYADTLYELGVLHTETGNHEQGEAELRAALATRERRLGPGHSKVAEALTALGESLSRQRKLDEAIATNERALDLYASLFGPDSRYAYRVVNNLGHDHWRKDDLARAIEEFEKTLELTRRFYPNHPDEGIVLVNIADVLYQKQDYPAALDNYRSSLEIFEKHMPDHGKIHMIRLRIGLCLGYQSRFAEAERYFEPAFRAVERTPVFNRTTVQRAAKEIIAVYSAWGRRDKISFYEPFLADSG